MEAVRHEFRWISLTASSLSQVSSLQSRRHWKVRPSLRAEEALLRKACLLEATAFRFADTLRQAGASAEQFLVNGIVHIFEDVKNNIHGFLLAFSVIHNLAYGALRSLSVEAMENACGNTAEGHAVTLFPAARLRQER